MVVWLYDMKDDKTLKLTAFVISIAGYQKP